MNDQRIKELARMPKAQLAQMHTANGGLMGLATYLKWTKDELLTAVIEDESPARQPSTIESPISGKTWTLPAGMEV